MWSSLIIDLWVSRFISCLELEDWHSSPWWQCSQRHISCGLDFRLDLRNSRLRLATSRNTAVYRYFGIFLRRFIIVGHFLLPRVTKQQRRRCFCALLCTWKQKQREQTGISKGRRPQRHRPFVSRLANDFLSRRDVTECRCVTNISQSIVRVGRRRVQPQTRCHLYYERVVTTSSQCRSADHYSWPIK